MRIVIGGQKRKAGKTSLGVCLLRDFAGLEWTTVKMTAHAHGPKKELVCLWASATDEKSSAQPDSARFLQAGAARACLLAGGEAASRAAALVDLAQSSSNLLVESNIAAAVLRNAGLEVPFLMVVTPADPEVKESARAAIHEADALVIAGDEAPVGPPAWIPAQVWNALPRFLWRSLAVSPANLVAWLQLVCLADRRDHPVPRT